MNNLSWKILAVLALALVVPGCGPGGPPVYKAGGTVNYGGKAISGATVTFLYEDGDFASGVTDATGKYTLTLPNNPKGAKAGKCTVSVAKAAGSGSAAPAPAPESRVPKLDSSVTDAMKTEKAKMDKEGPPKSEIPMKYGTATSSGLAFEIKPNDTDNNFPIELKD